MNTTIAIAIITALATIAGGSTAAIISMISQNRQHNLEEEARRRQTCRDAYVDLLTKFDEVVAIIDTIWEKPAATEGPDDVLSILSTPVDCYKIFRIALNTVYLEGPDGVADAAWDLVKLFNEEQDLIIKYVHENAGKPGRLSSHSNRKEIIDKRIVAKNLFIHEAAKALKIDS